MSNRYNAIVHSTQSDAYNTLETKMRLSEVQHTLYIKRSGRADWGNRKLKEVEYTEMLRPSCELQGHPSMACAFAVGPALPPHEIENIHVALLSSEDGPRQSNSRTR